MPSYKILVIDDEEAFRDLVKVRLAASGYSVMTAGNGAEGIETAEKEPPDLILLDIMMPEMDGYTVLRELKKREKVKNIPVIIITCKDKMQGLFMPEGVKGYIVKPYNAGMLLSMIRKTLGE